VLDHRQLQVLLEIAPDITEHLLGQADLLVALHVHQGEHVAGAVQVLHGRLLHPHLGDRLAGTEGALDHRAGLDVLELGADEGPALAGLDVLELDHVVELALQLHGHAVADVCGGCHGLCLSGHMG